MLRTAIVAVATIVGTAIVAFALQMTALGRPTNGSLALVATLHRLSKYQHSTATIDLAGHLYNTSCRDQWLGDRRAAKVLVDDRRQLLEVGGRLEDTGRIAWAEFQLAGCPRPLLHWLTTELTRYNVVDARRGEADARPAIIFRLPKARPKIAVVVSAATSLPLEVVLSGRLRGFSDLAYGNTSS